MYCCSYYVPSAVPGPNPGQPDDLEKLTIFGVLISAEDPSMVIMHEALQNIPYKLVPEAMQSRKSRKQHPRMKFQWTGLSTIHSLRYECTEILW